MRCVICGRKPTKLLNCSICGKVADYVCDGWLCQPSMWALKPGEKSVVKLMQLKCEHCDGDLNLHKLPSSLLLQSLPMMSESSPCNSLSLRPELPMGICSSTSMSDVVVIHRECGIQQPRFRPPHVKPVQCGSRELVERCSKLLVLQTETRNYDRVIFINCFLDFYKSIKLRYEDITPSKALELFSLDSLSLLSAARGGHCGALCSDLATNLSMGYLCASKLPGTYQQNGAPALCHVGHIIPFQNPEVESDCGLILLEPGFNIVQPIVLKKGVKQVIESEKCSFIWEGEMITYLPEPPPTRPRDIREKSMTYRIDELLNPDSSITVPLLAVDARPCILRRDDRGKVIAKLIVNFDPKKRQVEMAVGDRRGDPIKFEEILKSDDWLSEDMARLLHSDKGTLLRRIRQLVANEEMLRQLREERIKLAND